MNNKYVKYKVFYLFFSVHADLGIYYKILRERFFLTLFSTTATLKYIKQASKIQPETLK